MRVVFVFFCGCSVAHFPIEGVSVPYISVELYVICPSAGDDPFPAGLDGEDGLGYHAYAHLLCGDTNAVGDGELEDCFSDRQVRRGDLGSLLATR